MRNEMGIKRVREKPRRGEISITVGATHGTVNLHDCMPARLHDCITAEPQNCRTISVLIIPLIPEFALILTYF
jgi:hypothetical protein